MDFFDIDKLFFFSIVLVFLSCKKEPESKPGFAAYDDTPYEISYANNTLPATNLPQDNPLTVSKVKLGRMLFYEKLLSKDNSMACATCHLQEKGFSDPEQFSIGVEGLPGKRQAMGVINLAWNENGFFWDGRASLLRHQSLMPIEDPLEMNETLANVINKVGNDDRYKNQFSMTFGDTVVTEQRISHALEAFMFSVVSDNSKYDRFLAGKEALTESEERGRKLFFAEYNEFFPDLSGADCAHCHAGNNFENDKYMNNGLDSDSEMSDLGRFEVTGKDQDKGKFKVTTLRNIAVTGPYMHDGRFQTLEEVIEHYNVGIKQSSTLDPTLQNTKATGLMLDEGEIKDLIAFLNTLTDDDFLSNPAYQSPF